MDKRLLAFLGLSVMVFVVWVGLQAMFMPPAPPKKPADKAKAEEKPALAVDQVILALKGEEGHALTWLSGFPSPAKPLFSIPMIVTPPNVLAAKLNEARKAAQLKAAV